MFADKFPRQYIRFAADMPDGPENGLSGAKFVEATSAYAVEYDAYIPHASTCFKAPNKRAALSENLMRFTPEQR